MKKLLTKSDIEFQIKEVEELNTENLSLQEKYYYQQKLKHLNFRLEKLNELQRVKDQKLEKQKEKMKSELAFYNTTNLSESEETKATLKANKQGIKILILLKNLKDAEGNYMFLTPYQVLDAYKQKFGEILITSVRRSLSDLEDMGFVYADREGKVVERFGSKNFKYKFLG